MAHPLVLAVLASDLVALALVAAASVTAGRLVLGYRPAASDRAQLALERRAEVGALQARGGLVLLVLSSGLLVVALASVLPGLVPGAMCGVGVLEAAGPSGPRALALRGLALAGLGAHGVVERLDRCRPEGPLALAASRALLVSSPLVALAVIETARALAAVSLSGPVDCCAAVYDAVAAGRAGGGPLALGAPLTSIVVAVGLVLAGLGLAVRAGLAPGRLGAAALAGLALVFVPIAAVGLARELSAYHYGVLAHDCPWCLFAGRHRLVGYPLYGALAVVAFEGLAAALARLVAGRVPAVEPAARARARSAGLRVAVATVLFLGLGAGPALLHRLAYGVWISG